MISKILCLVNNLTSYNLTSETFTMGARYLKYIANVLWGDDYITIKLESQK